MARKISIKGYKKKLDAMWSKVIRTKYNHTCIMCSKNKDKGDLIHAHHAVKRKASGNQARYDIRNGVALCYECHILKLHGEQADLQWHKDYLKKIDELIPEDIQNQIIQDSARVIQNNALDMIETHLNNLTSV